MFKAGKCCLRYWFIDPSLGTSRSGTIQHPAKESVGPKRIRCRGPPGRRTHHLWFAGSCYHRLHRAPTIAKTLPFFVFRFALAGFWEVTRPLFLKPWFPVLWQRTLSGHSTMDGEESVPISSACHHLPPAAGRCLSSCGVGDGFGQNAEGLLRTLSVMYLF